MKKRIVLTTFGSLGDLHPYIAIALGLQSRGHEAVIATSAIYRQKIETLGIGFRAVRPDHPDWNADPDLARRAMDRRTGIECVVREVVMPVLRESYEDTLAAADGADLLISHAITLAARLVGEKKGIPWASTMLHPIGFMSAYDPPVLPSAEFLAKFRFLGPTFHRLLFGLAKRSVRSWCEPWHRLRTEIGLQATNDDPLFEGKHAPSLVLAMFSKVFAAKQPDWPSQTVVTGVPFYDQDGEAGLSPELACFLNDGPAPIVFTLGSAAVLDAGRFYEHSTKQPNSWGVGQSSLSAKTHGTDWPRCPKVSSLSITHRSRNSSHGRRRLSTGRGRTTAQAMRSGRPMLVMPYAHDQPDNADRVVRLGIGRSIARHRYNASRAAAELRELLDNPSYGQRASGIGEQVRKEDGVACACEALEGMLTAAAWHA